MVSLFFSPHFAAPPQWAQAWPGERRRKIKRVQHVKSPPLRQRKHARGDFVHRVLAHFAAALRAKRAARARVEQAQIIVNFGGRRHGRARIARRIFLLDRDGGSDPGNLIHIGFFNALEKLPRVRRKRLDVPPLPLGVNRVKRQTRFPRSRNPRDDRDGVMRNVEADVLQVVNARPEHMDRLLLGGLGGRACRGAHRQRLFSGVISCSHAAPSSAPSATHI